MACAPSKDSDQPGHPPSLIRVFAVRLKTARILIYPLGASKDSESDWAEAQADLGLRWAHMPFCLFCHDAAHFQSWPCPLSSVFYNATKNIILIFEMTWIS